MSLMRDRMIDVEFLVDFLEIFAVHVTVEYGFVDTRIDSSGTFYGGGLIIELDAVSVEIHIDLMNLDFHSIPPIP